MTQPEFAGSAPEAPAEVPRRWIGAPEGAWNPTLSLFVGVVAGVDPDHVGTLLCVHRPSSIHGVTVCDGHSLQEDATGRSAPPAIPIRRPVIDSSHSVTLVSDPRVALAVASTKVRSG